MAINRVEIEDFLAFKGKFMADFCPGVNVFIGGNGTGKTTLLREMYSVATRNPHYFSQPLTHADMSMFVHEQLSRYKYGELSGDFNNIHVGFNEKEITSTVYITEKDILEHAKGLLTFIEQKQTGFSQIYKDVLLNAQDIPTQKQTEVQKHIGGIISDIIGGEIKWDKGDGSFYTIKANGNRIPFANEASGFKKFGFLGLLVASGKLDPGSVLFWDEPENSLNPELVPVLVDILLELSRNGVQIFIATHSEILASYFSVLKGKDDSVMFYSLYKDGEQIKYDSNDRFNLLNPNNLIDEPVKLYEKQLDKVLGDE